MNTYIKKVKELYNEHRKNYVETLEEYNQLLQERKEVMKDASLSAEGRTKKIDAINEKMATIRHNAINELDAYNKECEAIKQEAKKEHDNQLSALPLDTNVIEKMKLGIFTKQELLNMINRYDDNEAMQRVLLNYCDTTYQNDKDVKQYKYTLDAHKHYIDVTIDTFNNYAIRGLGGGRKGDNLENENIFTSNASASNTFHTYAIDCMIEYENSND